MPKYRKKPVVIEAEQWFPGKEIDGVVEVEARLHYSYGLMDQALTTEETKPIRVGMIETLEGNMYVSLGDYVITGVKGEKYPCKPDIFEQTYEKVEE